VFCLRDKIVVAAEEHEISDSRVSVILWPRPRKAPRGEELCEDAPKSSEHLQIRYSTDDQGESLSGASRRCDFPVFHTLIELVDVELLNHLLVLFLVPQFRGQHLSGSRRASR